MLSSWAAFNGTSANGNDSSSFFLLRTAMCCGHWYRVSQMALLVKNPSADVGDIRDVGSIPGSGRSPGGGHGNPLQYSCLKNPMDGGAWRAIVHGVAKVGQDWSNWARMQVLSGLTMQKAYSFLSDQESRCLGSGPSSTIHLVGWSST